VSRRGRTNRKKNRTLYRDIQDDMCLLAMEGYSGEESIRMISKLYGEPLIRKFVELERERSMRRIQKAQVIKDISERSREERT